MKHFIWLLLLGSMFAQSLPEAPQPHSIVSTRQQTLTWKKTLDWKFAAVHSLYFGAMLFDQQETLDGEAKGCALEQGDPTPYRASRGDLMKKNLPFFAGVTVADMFMRKVGIKWAWMTGALIGSAKHFKGGVDWINMCK